MRFKYINKIKSLISLNTTLKSKNILEGDYYSIYYDKSLNFNSLREYIIGDDIRDVDWKSSIRKGKLLTKQYNSLRNHNFLFIMDTGSKMIADTDMHESKKEIALYSAGILGYLAIQNNNSIELIYSSDKSIYSNICNSFYSLDESLINYEKCADVVDSNIDDLLQYIYKTISKRMIIVVITDLAGVESISINTLKKLKYNNDVLIININDNNLSGNNVYDIETNKYIPRFFLEDKMIDISERNIKEHVLSNCSREFKSYGIYIQSVSSINDISNAIIKLLEENKYASKK